jgi:hypothetical protein
MSEIKSEFEKHIGEIDKLFVDFPIESKEHFIQWMGQHFKLVEHSTRILALYCGLTPTDEKADFTHLKEEMGHEKILLNDGKKFGQDLRELPKGPAASALISAVYGDMVKKSKESCLGYVLLLEGLSLTSVPKLAKRVADTYGNEKGTFLTVHIEADETHFPDGIAKVEKLPLKIQKEIIETLKYSAFLYESLIVQAKQLADEALHGKT